ncbi:DNA translocase FtsK [Amphibiibacter pelophylacis]|uniref:DNA translocase FtsK n=1 Tax=Amphibiibacter pelophylacis TaxID=1799477 RepID=UPI003BFA77D3
MTSLPEYDEIQSSSGFMLGLHDPLFSEAVLTFNIHQDFPVSKLQRQYRIGYGRAVSLYKALVTAQASV